MVNIKVSYVNNLTNSPKQVIFIYKGNTASLLYHTIPNHFELNIRGVLGLTGVYFAGNVG